MRPDRSQLAPQPEPRGVVSALLTWFELQARDLPWRRTRDAYAVWVSEIMLQQTQVKTVIPFWERWMERLPTIQSLARARSQTIHKLWEGLGYYTRVRNMQKAARLIVREHDGNFPRHFAKVLALPGIGRYTAGAVCSIAFNQPRPILDGNVIRVLTRIFAVFGDPKAKSVNARLWEYAEVLVQAAAQSASPKSPATRGDRNCSKLNQALMELGALSCTPKQPKCESCPVKGYCVAAREGLVDLLPQIKARPPATRRNFIAFVFSDRDRFLVRQRPPSVVNSHLWEFPNLERIGANGNSPRSACRRLGGDPSSLRPLCAIQHSITRYRISLKAFRAVVEPSSKVPRIAGEWLRLSELERLPFASAHKQILEVLRRTADYATY